jgi:hypothetical protein
MTPHLHPAAALLGCLGLCTAAAQPTVKESPAHATELAFARTLLSQVDRGDIFDSLPADQRANVTAVRGWNLIVRKKRADCHGAIPERQLLEVQTGANPAYLTLVFRSRVTGWEFSCQESLLLRRTGDGGLVLEQYNVQAAAP